jgi:hypothetical protein
MCTYPIENLWIFGSEQYIVGIFLLNPTTWGSANPHPCWKLLFIIYLVQKKGWFKLSTSVQHNEKDTRVHSFIQRWRRRDVVGASKPRPPTVPINPGIDRWGGSRAGTLHLNGVRRIRRPPSPSPTGTAFLLALEDKTPLFQSPHRVPEAQLVGEEKMHPIPISLPMLKVAGFIYGVINTKRLLSFSFARVGARSQPRWPPSFLCRLQSAVVYFSGGCRLGSGKGNDGDGRDSCAHRVSDAGGLFLSILPSVSAQLHTLSSRTRCGYF